jgi:NitT/TauT family transport system substrate-binding protein
MCRKGQSTKIVNVMQDRCTFYLLGRPEIGEVKALKGKTIGVTKVGAESYAVARAILTRAGLDPEKDAELVGVGGMATTASALENDRCQAVIGWQPLAARFLAEGKAVNLASLNRAQESQQHLGYPNYSFTIIQVNDAYLKQNPETVQRFVNALVACEKWLAGQSSAALAQAALPYFPGLSPELLQASIEQDREAFSPTGLVSRQGHESVVKVWLEAKILDEPVPFEAIVDNSFSQKAQDK